MALYPQSAKTYRSQGVANRGTVKSGEGVLLSLAVHNLSTGVRYLLLQNSVEFDPLLPLSDSIPVYANSGYTVMDSAFFTVLGESYPLGISWGFSTNPLTYQAAGTNECLLKVRYL